MRALQVVGRGKLRLDDAPVPVLADGEVLVRTSHAAVCGSDLHTIFHSDFAGPSRPGWPGHESVGAVVESRSARFAPGEQVLAVPDITCFASFADIQAVPERFLLRMPSGDPTALLMAQQMGTVEYALKRFLRGEPPTDTAVVIGTGTAGLHFITLLRRRGFTNVICSDVDENRLRTATALGATAVVNASGTRTSEAVLELTGGAGAGLVIEAVGTDATRADAALAVADLGVLGCFGVPEKSGLVGFPFETLFRRRATLHTSNLAQREPGLASFGTALSLIARGEVNVEPLLGAPYPAESLVDAIEAAEDHSAPSVKVVIDFTGPGAQ
jgi:threonine dehydrogenase-like Zn-dependent dehydrogenase